VDINIAGMKVAIGMPIYGGIPSGTALSLFRTVQACTARGVYLNYITFATSYVHHSRDAVVHEFLAGGCQKLFFIDQDQTWAVEDFARLLALSTKFDVVGAAYPAKKDPPTFYANLFPETKVEEYGLIKVRGMGLGFTIIDRSVLERLAAKADKIHHPHFGKTLASIFRVDNINGSYRGEDIAFFADILDLGVDVWMDPGIELGHIGQKEWRGRFADELNALAQPKEPVSEGIKDAIGW
jgi:hypothetical protein